MYDLRWWPLILHLELSKLMWHLFLWRKYMPEMKCMSYSDDFKISSSSCLNYALSYMLKLKVDVSASPWHHYQDKTSWNYLYNAVKFKSLNLHIKQWFKWMFTFARMASLCTLSAALSFLIKSISLTRHSNLSLHLVSTWKLLSKLGGTGTLWPSLKCLHTEDVFCLWPSTRWCKCARVKPTYPALHRLH